jgi:hypothetical protein
LTAVEISWDSKKSSRGAVSNAAAVTRVHIGAVEQKAKASSGAITDMRWRMDAAHEAEGSRFR